MGKHSTEDEKTTELVQNYNMAKKMVDIAEAVSSPNDPNIIRMRKDIKLIEDVLETIKTLDSQIDIDEMLDEIEKSPNL